MQERIDHHVLQSIRHKRALLEGAKRHPLIASPLALLSEHYQRIDDLQMQLDRSTRYLLSHQSLKLSSLKRELHAKRPEVELRNLKEKLSSYAKQIELSLMQTLSQKRERLKQALRHLESLSPESILKKGYCIPFAEKGHSVMMSIREAALGMRVRLRFHDGTILSKVEEVDGNKAP